jgi:hypothetical protein
MVCVDSCDSKQGPVTDVGAHGHGDSTFKLVGNFLTS